MQKFLPGFFKLRCFPESKKAETRTKVDFLFERANILSKKPACKAGSKSKKANFLRQTLTLINKK